MFKSSEPSPELRATVIRAAARYLVHVVNNNENELNGAILWVDVLEKKNMTKEQYRFQMASLQDRFSEKNHPLLGLETKNVEWSGDRASVQFVKSAADNPAVIQVELKWAGAGWLVEDDNIFGEDALIERWTGVELEHTERDITPAGMRPEGLAGGNP